MQLTSDMWQRIEEHFGRPCELNERGEIVYRDTNDEVGYIAMGEWAGWLVDRTGDRDKLVLNLKGDTQ